MKNNNILTVSMIAFAVTIITMAFNNIDVKQGDEWVVPEADKNMENPYADDEELLSIGKELYMQHCKSCHGKEGLGDGSKAETLDTPSGDFSSEEFQAQTDGAIFYKARIGRDDMPTFEKKISEDEDMWGIVNFIRTLKE